MSAVTDEPDPPGTSDDEKPKRRSARAGSGKKRAPKRKPKPPVRVEPSWVHEAIAAGILKLGADRAEAAAPGLPINVGSVPESIVDVVPEQDGATDDDKTPTELLARVIAHIFHRTPGMKRVEKKLEGKDLRSGFFADASALVLQLYRLNQPVIKAAVRAAMEERAARAKTATAPNNGAVVPPSEGATE